MCYDIKASYEAQLNRARRRNDFQAMEEILEKLIPLTDLPLYHTSGFSHPDVLIYTNRSPNFPEIATWGLIPHWVRDEEQRTKLWNSTLNARGETIFNKPSFRDAAQHNRCIIYIDGFYEHHHFENQVYPFFIAAKTDDPLALAGLWSEWKNNEGGISNTFTIVTTEGNALLSKIHNNPKLKGPRMPLILSKDQEDIWLETGDLQIEEKKIAMLLNSSTTIALKAHTVNKLRGKNYKGNVPEISEEFIYETLKF